MNLASNRYNRSDESHARDDVITFEFADLVPRLVIKTQVVF